MSTAQAPLQEAWLNPTSGVLEQEPEEREHTAPRDERQSEDVSQTVAPPKPNVDLPRIAVLLCLAVSQLAWMSALAYLALLFLT